MKKKYVTYKDVESIVYYDPRVIGMPINYKATVFDFIQEYRNKLVDIDVIFLVLVREEYVTRKQAAWFALKCIRRVQYLVTDQRGIYALDSIEKYLEGKATRKELRVSKYKAYEAFNCYKTDIYLAIHYAINAVYYDAIHNSINSPDYARYVAYYTNDDANTPEIILKNLRLDILLEILK